MKRFISILLLFLVTNVALSIQFSGVIKDQATKAPVPFASIFLPDMGMVTTCDSVGAFNLSITLPNHINVVVSAFGYESKKVRISTEKTTSLEIFLNKSSTTLGTVIVSSQRNALERLTISNIEAVKLDNPQMATAATLGDMIAMVPGVYQNTIGTGISKPVIRGLSGNRVVSYLNGLRIENQQWGGDHALGVSDLGVGRVEVIKGPSSLLYGSDALGGVLYMIDVPYAEHNTVEVLGSSRFETVSLGTKNVLGVKLSKGKVRFNLHGNYVSHADYQLPNGKYGMSSRFNEKNIKMAFGFNHKSWVTNLRYNYLQNRLGIPGHTHDPIITPETFQVEEQNRYDVVPAQVNHNHYLLWENNIYFGKNKLEVILGQTMNELQEYEEKFSIPALHMQLNSSTYNIRYKHDIGDTWNWVVGAQGMYQTNRNDNGVEEQLIPDANLLDNAAYLLLGKTLSDTWSAETGLRLDTRMISAFNDAGEGTDLTGTYTNLNYSLGIAKITKYLNIKANLTSGYRAPHTSELLSNGAHHGALRYEIGNRDLEAEKAIQADLDLEYNNAQWKLFVNPFVNVIADYIALNPLDSTINSLPVFAYTQLDNATLYGIETGFSYEPKFADFLKLSSNYSNVIGEDANGAPLSLIPQSRINSSLEFKFNSDQKIRFNSIIVQHQYLFAQDKVSQFETPTDSYQVINLGVSMHADGKADTDLRFGVRNLLNEEYIDHLSRLKNIGMANPGLNFYAELIVKLKHKLK